MSLQLSFGIILLLGGVTFLYVGLQASQASYEQDFESFSQSLTDSTAWYLVGGFLATLSGLILLIVRSFHQYSLYAALADHHVDYAYVSLLLLP